MRRWGKLGLIAGGGNLPVRLAQNCQALEAPFYVVRLTSYADPEMTQYEGEECGIAEMGKLIRILRDQNCDAICMAGIVRRPNLSALKPDWRGVALMPKVVAAARRGDGALLDVMVKTFEAEGFLVIGAEEVSGALFAPAGQLGVIALRKPDLADLRKAAQIINAIGKFDVGQGAVVRNGLVLAIEAAEGTDLMLERCANLPDEVKGYEPGEENGLRGVLLKRPKPGQELRVDLPTIGAQTIIAAHRAGLAGVAVEAEASLIIDAAETYETADRLGLFVYGFNAGDLET